MKTRWLSPLARRLAVVGAGLAFCLSPAWSQVGGGFVAPTDAMDTLNQGPVGPTGAGQQALERAQQLPGAQTPGGLPGDELPGLEAFDLPGAGEQIGEAAGRARQALTGTITVITGTRVFDAVTGELLDDPQERQVAAALRDSFFDDGTHGDLLAEDGQYTNVDTRSDVVGPLNQRVKEQLVKALLVAEQMGPIEFYGLTLLSTQRHRDIPRSRAWKLVPDEDGPGYMLREVEVDEPLTVPKFREVRMERDAKLRDDWADRFLQEYRKNKDSLTSEFYPLYIPLPPVPPSTAPPAPETWQPFATPNVLEDIEGEDGGRIRFEDWARTDNNVTGEPIGNASSRYF